MQNVSFDALELLPANQTVFEEEEDPSSKSFFSEIISSISDVQFARDGRYILSRDYLTLKIWDVNMEKMPVKTINMHDVLRNKLCDLYENDCIFDKFECTFSGDGKNVLSGSYNNNFMIYPTNSAEYNSEKEVMLQADKSAFKAKKGTAGKKSNGRGTSPSPRTGGIPALDAEKMDFSKKILHASWHPREDSIAIAATNNVILGNKDIQSNISSCLYSPRSSRSSVLGIVNLTKHVDGLAIHDIRRRPRRAIRKRLL